MLVVACLTCCLCCYLWVDRPVALWLHTNTTPPVRAVASFLEELGKAHWFLVTNLVVIAATWRGSRRTAAHHGAFFLSIAASGIMANIVKVIVCRARPPLLFDEGVFGFFPLTWHTDFLHTSFPSGHATTGLAIAVAGSLTHPRKAWLFWTIGLAIAIGRVVYTVHYVSDVVAGGLLGALTALWCVRYLKARFGTTW